jgi:hypothetical protein
VFGGHGLGNFTGGWLGNPEQNGGFNLKIWENHLYMEVYSWEQW